MSGCRGGDGGGGFMFYFRKPAFFKLLYSFSETMMCDPFQKNKQTILNICGTPHVHN